jgi:hypothetical protein
MGVFAVGIPEFLNKGSTGAVADRDFALSSILLIFE